MFRGGKRLFSAPFFYLYEKTVAEMRLCVYNERIPWSGERARKERQRVMKRSFFSALIAAMVWTVACGLCSAETVDFSDMDLRFVDAREDTGYYVDMNAVDIKNMNEATARVEIVKIDKNCLYLYTIAFDRGKKTYQILDSLVAAYDTKEMTGGSTVPLKPQSYAKGSAMETVAEYIYSPQL